MPGFTQVRRGGPIPGGRVMAAKYAGKCWECGTRFPAGAQIKWYGQGRCYGIGCCGVHNGFQTQTIVVRDPAEDAADRWAETHPFGEDQAWIDHAERDTGQDDPRDAWGDEEPGDTY